MRQAKSEGRNRWAFVDPNFSHQASCWLQLEAEIRQGLAGGEFRAWFMPVQTLTTARLSGYEAVVRWVRPVGDPQEPEAFLACAEHSGVIVGIDQAVLVQSVALLARLPAPLSVAVSVSAAMLVSGDYPARVLEL